MPPLSAYQLYLFDFDGVLVDTESTHFKAYQLMLHRRGFQLPWTEHDYARIALFKASGIKEALFQKLPKLYAQEPNWEVLYQEKRACYLELIAQEGTHLMPGVEELLSRLHSLKIPSCVVTHSPKEQIDAICDKHPALMTITHWVTRECYHHPKPHPECYEYAISRYAKPGDQIIGFEDSPRGMMALSHTKAFPFLVTTFLASEDIGKLQQQTPKPFVHVPTFLDLLTSNVLKMHPAFYIQEE